MSKFSLLMSEDEETFGPGTDIVISLASILLILIAIGVLSYNKASNEILKLKDTVSRYKVDTTNTSKLVTKIKDLERQLSVEKGNNIASKKYIASLESKINNLEQKRSEYANAKHDKPPIIPLSDASGYSFISGSAELSNSFREELQDHILPRLEDIFKKYDVNVIEIVGHTDGQIIAARNKSNLDHDLEYVCLNSGSMSIRDLTFTSNVELGLLRALSVKKFLESIATDRLPHIKFRVYSAAQLIPPGRTTGAINRDPDARRRRIELRFTKLED